MKKSLIGTLGLGLVLGSLGMNVFANDRAPLDDQIYRNNTNSAINTSNQGTAQESAKFETLYQNISQAETLDNNSNNNLETNSPDRNNQNNYNNQVRNNQGYDNNNGNNNGGNCNGPGSCRR